MTQPLKEIADRIIVCGFSEMGHHLKSGKVGAIVTACKSRQCEDDTRQLIEDAQKVGILHHQSLVFEYIFEWHNAFSLTPEEVKVKNVTPEEWKVKIQDFLKEKTEDTLNFIDNFFAEDSDQKIIIHCAQGSDRSAILAVAYFLKTQDDQPSIDKALGALYQTRPQAGLHDVVPFLESHFGENYEDYLAAINLYRGTAYINTNIKSDEAQFSTEFDCLKDVFDDIYNSLVGNNSEYEGPTGIQRYLTHASNCNRFGIPIPTWLTKDTAPYGVTSGLPIRRPS
jgi:hypothetical protein